MLCCLLRRGVARRRSCPAARAHQAASCEPATMADRGRRAQLVGSELCNDREIRRAQARHLARLASIKVRGRPRLARRDVCLALGVRTCTRVRRALPCTRDAPRGHTYDRARWSNSCAHSPTWGAGWSLQPCRAGRHPVNGRAVASGTPLGSLGGAGARKEARGDRLWAGPRVFRTQMGRHPAATGARVARGGSKGPKSARA